MRFLGLSLLLMFLTLTVLAQTPWQKYIANPTPDNAELVDELSYDHSVGGEEQEVDVMVLESQVFAGDRAAIFLAYRIIKKSGGSIAEDLYQSLGLLIRINPKLFLETLQDSYNDSIDIGALVGNLGIAFVDRPSARRYELAARIKAIDSVHSGRLKKVRDICHKEIENQLKQVN